MTREETAAKIKYRKVTVAFDSGAVHDLTTLAVTVLTRGVASLVLLGADRHDGQEERCGNLRGHCEAGIRRFERIKHLREAFHDRRCSEDRAP